MPENTILSRREMLTRCGTGFGMIGLAGVLMKGKSTQHENRWYQCNLTK